MTTSEPLSPREQQAVKNRRLVFWLVCVIAALVAFSFLFVAVINPRIHKTVPRSARAAVLGETAPESAP